MYKLMQLSLEIAAMTDRGITGLPLPHLGQEKYLQFNLCNINSEAVRILFRKRK
jgi:hypothetical protein